MRQRHRDGHFYAGGEQGNEYRNLGQRFQQRRLLERIEVERMEHRRPYDHPDRQIDDRRRNRQAFEGGQRKTHGQQQAADQQKPLRGGHRQVCFHNSSHAQFAEYACGFLGTGGKVLLRPLSCPAPRVALVSPWILRSTASSGLQFQDAESVTGIGIRHPACDRRRWVCSVLGDAECRRYQSGKPSGAGPPAGRRGCGTVFPARRSSETG